MRRIPRLPLPPGVRFALARRQVRVNQQRKEPGFKASRTWDSARRKVCVLAAEATLKRMAGPTERCMYCEDSHGADIEHFWPKTPYPECMFLWENLLLCCTECGRAKSNRFPFDAAGRPLLIDPCSENPWDHLDFDPDTGNLVPRFRLDTGDYSDKGEATVEHLRLDRREALARMYRRNFLRLAAVVSTALESPKRETSEIISGLCDQDDSGLLPWCFHGNGQHVKPFANLRSECPDVWQACYERFS